MTDKIDVDLEFGFDDNEDEELEQPCEVIAAKPSKPPPNEAASAVAHETNVSSVIQKVTANDVYN